MLRQLPGPRPWPARGEAELNREAPLDISGFSMINNCLCSASALVLLCFLPSLCVATGYSVKPFSRGDYEAYVRHYSQLSGPLQHFPSDDMFLVAKGAELTVQEYNQKHDMDFQLRFIKQAHLIPENKPVQTIHYQLNVEHPGGSFYQGCFEAEAVLYPNLTIAIILLKGEIKKNLLKNECDELSRQAGCTQCSIFERCEQGHVPTVPWLDFAFTTQQEIQIDEIFTMVQMPAAHNAYNARASGYGVLDDCPWPPPYQPECIDLANQEFSFTDLLNMGIRSLEIDPWWCFHKMRMSHALDRAAGCSPLDRTFADGMQEIGEWVNDPQNTGKVIRIYLEDGPKHTEGHDDLINGPLQEYLGDRVFTPEDHRTLGRWPTLREMRNMNKTVLVTTDYTTNHGGIYIHEGYWTEFIRNKFTPYPQCGGSADEVLRYYCDSTNYGPFWNGPKETGVILDFTEFMKCGIQYPAADQVNPRLLETAVWTWASGQPAKPLTNHSCVFLNGTDHRWYSTLSCNTVLPQACLNTSTNQWLLGAGGQYGQAHACPEGSQFSLPVNGFKQQQLIAASRVQSVWINITPFIPLLTNNAP